LICAASLVALGLSSPGAQAAPALPEHYSELYFDAARAGRTDLLGGMIADGAPVDEVDSHGYTALILAAYDGQRQTVEFLMARGANPCASDLRGDTALMGVAFKGETEIADLLVGRCDVNATNKVGQTAAMMASLFGREDVVRLLVQHGARLDIKDASGRTAADLAREQGNSAMEALIGRLSGPAQPGASPPVLDASAKPAGGGADPTGGQAPER
jgi:hypothetical protein